HEMHLTSTLQNVDAFLLRLYRIAVEVSGSLFKLGEVLHTLHGALRAEEALDVYAAQRRSVDSVAMFVWTNVADGVRGRVSVPVRVAVETGHPLMGPQSSSIFRGIELSLSEGCHKQAQAFELFRIQDLFE